MKPKKPKFCLGQKVLLSWGYRREGWIAGCQLYSDNSYGYAVFCCFSSFPHANYYKPFGTDIYFSPSIWKKQFCCEWHLEANLQAIEGEYVL